MPSPECLQFISRWEGFSSTVYLCPAGIPTIGYGHAVKDGEVFPDSGITKEQGIALLDLDCMKAQRSIARLIKIPITDQQLTAITSFTFNLGSGALQRSSLRRVINRGEWASVRREWLKWVWAGGRRLPGLVRRRNAEIALFFNKNNIFS
jgi:lysozyme